MTNKEKWDSQSPEERRLSLSHLIVNVSLNKVNPCIPYMCEIGYQYSMDMNSFYVFKVQHDHTRNITYAFSKYI